MVKKRITVGQCYYCKRTTNYWACSKCCRKGLPKEYLWDIEAEQTKEILNELPKAKNGKLLRVRTPAKRVFKEKNIYRRPIKRHPGTKLKAPTSQGIALYEKMVKIFIAGEIDGI